MSKARDLKVSTYTASALFAGAFALDEVWHRAILGIVLGGGAIVNAWRAGRASRSRV